MEGRASLTAFAAMGRDIKLSEERIEGYRHFVNKLWNAARFTLMNLGEKAPEPVDLGSVEGLNNRWILHRLELLKQDMDKAFDEYRFNDVAQGGYKFLWGEFCDWYLELIKPDMANEATKKESSYVLYTVLKEILVLLHPVMPFVTAEIWQALPGHEGEDLATMPWPEERPDCIRPEDAARMEFVQGVIVAVRTIKAELDIAPSHKVVLKLHPADKTQEDLLLSNASTIQTLARLESMEVGMEVHAPKASASSVVQGCEIIVPLKGNVDLQGELARLAKEMGKIADALAVVDKKLSNESFVSRAKPEIVQRERDRAAELKDNLGKLEVLKQRFTEALEGGEE